MKTFFIFFVCLSCFCWCNGQGNPKVWTKSYTDGFYRYLDSVMKPHTPDSSKRVDFILFIIARAKQEIPNGLQSVSKDSLKNLNIRIGQEYATKLRVEGRDSQIIPYYEKWTSMIEKTIRYNFTVLNQQGKAIKSIDKFCDCVIEKLKKMYPDSVRIPIPQESLNKIGLDCKKIDAEE